MGHVEAQAARGRGFTIIEGLVCLALTALLATWAAPGAGRWLGDWQTRQATGALRESLDLARIHALGASAAATVCASADGLDCQSGKEADWAAGWIVFLDRNGDGRRDGDEPLLHARGPTMGVARITPSASGLQRLVFLPNGQLNSTPASLRFVATHADVPVRRLVLNRVGRAREVVER